MHVPKVLPIALPGAIPDDIPIAMYHDMEEVEEEVVTVGEDVKGEEGLRAGRKRRMTDVMLYLLLYLLMHRFTYLLPYLSQYHSSYLSLYPLLYLLPGNTIDLMPYPLLHLVSQYLMHLRVALPLT